MAPRKKNNKMQWFRMDLHLHTPASADYQEAPITYLDILRKAELRGLDIIAFTDHNTIGGYAAMMREIEGLAYLERLGRAQPDELKRLNEYRRLLDKILVLPGFEFTATFGFHILGIFAPETPLRLLEHLLLSLHVPAHVLDEGNSEVGASSDVLTAYQVIHEAGGLCIAAHANSAHGVAMKGFDFGGQTRIAYTQDKHLHALEVTDLGKRVRDSTERFFNGTKQGYPRRMRCIQGSDAHRLNALTDKNGKITLYGVGDRVTEVALPERSFAALYEMFMGADFARSRAYNPKSQPVDYIQQAREEGPSLVQSFHEQMSRAGGRLYSVIADVCAFANTNGGNIYVGVDPDVQNAPVGIDKPHEATELLQQEISRMISPSLEVEIDVVESRGKSIVRIQVPPGDDRPYAIDENRIYVRDEAETSLAVRDEIVNLVLGSRRPTPPPTPAEVVPPPPVSAPVTEPPAVADGPVLKAPPSGGVEIIEAQRRGDTVYYTMRDLRNGNIVKNVTRNSARRLWHYAIKQREGNPVRADKVQWQGEIGLWQRYQKNGETRYDLVQRSGDELHVYYGVAENGMSGEWHIFFTPDEPSEPA